MSRDFVGALLQLNAEKQISREQLIGAVEDGIQSAYRRVAGDEDIHVRIDAETGKIRVFRARRVVDEIEDELTEMTVEEARGVSTRAPSVGDLVETEQLDGDVFGRIGAQTAKQIVLQRIREVERDQVFDQFAEPRGRAHHRHRQPGRAAGDHPRRRQERRGRSSRRPSSRRSSTTASARTSRRSCSRSGARRAGPQIFVSRTHKGFLKRLFELEVPEIHSGTVEIKAIAREAGSRSKVAVASRQEGLDPVGATVGQRGARVQAVVAELSGEKIDVIPWNDDPAVFVANALSPAQVISVDIDEEHRIASVTVPERMLSLAIGREGQNARLAARLTGWRIDIRSDVSVAEAKAAPPTPRPRPPAAAEPRPRSSRRRRGARRSRSASPRRPPPKPPRPTRHRRRTAEPARRAGPAKPKRVTKKAAAEAAGADGAADRRPRRRRAAAEPRRPPSRSAPPKKAAAATEEVAS